MVSFTGAFPISAREGEAKFWITLYLQECIKNKWSETITSPHSFQPTLSTNKNPLQTNWLFKEMNHICWWQRMQPSYAIRKLSTKNSWTTTSQQTTEMEWNTTPEKNIVAIPMYIDFKRGRYGTNFPIFLISYILSIISPYCGISTLFS